MKIEVKKGHFLLAMAVLISWFGVFLVYAYGTNSPSTFGHSISEVAPPVNCQSGQVLQWDGSNWICATLTAGSGGSGASSIDYNDCVMSPPGHWPYNGYQPSQSGAQYGGSNTATVNAPIGYVAVGVAAYAEDSRIGYMKFKYCKLISASNGNSGSNGGSKSCVNASIESDSYREEGTSFSIMNNGKRLCEGPNGCSILYSATNWNAYPYNYMDESYFLIFSGTNKWITKNGNSGTLGNSDNKLYPMIGWIDKSSGPNPDYICRLYGSLSPYSTDINKLVLMKADHAPGDGKIRCYVSVCER